MYKDKVLIRTFLLLTSPRLLTCDLRTLLDFFITRDQVLNICGNDLNLKSSCHAAVLSLSFPRRQTTIPVHRSTLRDQSCSKLVSKSSQ
jgi:hypothetical protein